MNILILGGSGLLGHAVTQMIDYSEEDSLLVVDNLMYDRDYLYPYRFKFGDVSDSKFLSSLLASEKFDVVIHLAGIVGDYACRIHQKLSEKVNVESVKILCDNFDGKIIFPSSCSVYGSSDQLLDELSTLNPLSLYAEQKIRAEEILSNYQNKVIFRLATLHGITNRIRNDIVVNTLTMRAIQHGKIYIYGGEQWRPIIHVMDAAITFRDAIYSGSGLYNLYSHNYKIIDIGRHIVNELRNFGINISLIEENIPYEDYRNYKVISKNFQIDFKGRKMNYSIKDTVRQIYNLINDGRVKNLSNIAYSNVGHLEFTI